MCPQAFAPASSARLQQRHCLAATRRGLSALVQWPTLQELRAPASATRSVRRTPSPLRSVPTTARPAMARTHINDVKVEHLPGWARDRGFLKKQFEAGRAGMGRRRTSASGTFMKTRPRKRSVPERGSRKTAVSCPESTRRSTAPREYRSSAGDPLEPSALNSCALGGRYPPARAAARSEEEAQKPSTHTRLNRRGRYT